MKIFEQLPVPTVRLMITRSGDKSFYINLCETDRKSIVNWLQKLISKQPMDCNYIGKMTRIVVRDALGAKNLQSESVSFKGISPEQIYKLILKELENGSNN